MLLHYATQRHSIEHRARQETPRQERQVLRASEPKNKNSNKTRKKYLISKHEWDHTGGNQIFNFFNYYCVSKIVMVSGTTSENFRSLR